MSVSDIEKKQKFVWTGWFWEHSGYANMNRRYVRGLHDAGWDMGIEAISCPLEIKEDVFHFYNSLRNFRKYGDVRVPELYLDPDVVKVVCWIPVNGVPPFKHNIIYTMLESRSAGDFFVKTCNNNYNT